MFGRSVNKQMMLKKERYHDYWFLSNTYKGSSITAHKKHKICFDQPGDGRCKILFSVISVTS